VPAVPAAPTALGIGVALALVGVGFDSPSLLVAGLGLGGLAALFTAWVELARPTALERAPGPARMIEGEAYPLDLRSVGGLLPPPSGALSDPVLERPVPVGPGWHRRHRERVPMLGRGRRLLGPATIEIRDPLGLRRRVVASPPVGELLVLPRIEPITAAGSGTGGARSRSASGIDDGEAASRFDARAIELEVDGLRRYRTGSPASRIHWPAVARTGELVERNLIAGGDTAPLVALDASDPDSPESLDAAVRATASLCHHLATAGGCAALLPGDRRPTDIEPDLRTWPAVHAQLALVGPARSAPPLLRALRSGTVFWVAARATATMPPALRSGGARRYLIVPGAAGAGSAFAVAGCHGRVAGGRATRMPRRRVA
jgi:uncharacterized protein (DUF58 family)